MSNWDKEYLKLCKTILEEGKEVINRTGINTIKIPNYNFSFDLEKEFPFLTTKKLYYKAAIKELLWIYKGINDVRWLQDRGVHIWDEWEIDEDGIYRIYYPTGKEPENVQESLPVYFNTGKIGSDGKDILEKMYYDEDMTGNVAIVIGSEGFGMSRLVKENCDYLVKIPMKGKVTSLNAAVSAGIVMYETVKQRMK